MTDHITYTFGETNNAQNLRQEKKQINIPEAPKIKMRPSLKNALFIVLSVVIIYTIFSSLQINVFIKLLIVFLTGSYFGARNNRAQSLIINYFVEGRKNQLENIGIDSNDIERITKKDAQDIDFDISHPVIIWMISAPVIFLFVPTIYSELNDSLNILWVFLKWPLLIAIMLLLFLLLLGFGGLAANTPARIDFNNFSRFNAFESDISLNDRNDIAIISQVASLDSKHGRVETYTLESALLSALSFSSFLAIAISELDFRSDFHKIFDVKMNVCPQLNGSIDLFITDLSALPCLPNILTPEYINTNLTSLICLSLLMCATMFLGVLIARLRFNEVYRDADEAIKAASVFNEKEEQCLTNGRSDKAELYSSRIENCVQEAKQHERQLDINISYMKFSRNFGILFFILALILCGMYFHYLVSFVLAGVFIFSMSFFTIETIVRRLRMADAPNTIKNMRRGKFKV